MMHWLNLGTLKPRFMPHVEAAAPWLILVVPIYTAYFIGAQRLRRIRSSL